MQILSNGFTGKTHSWKMQRQNASTFKTSLSKNNTRMALLASKAHHVNPAEAPAGPLILAGTNQLQTTTLLKRNSLATSVTIQRFSSPKLLQHRHSESCEKTLESDQEFRVCQAIQGIVELLLLGVQWLVKQLLGFVGFLRLPWRAVWFCK